MRLTDAIAIRAIFLSMRYMLFEPYRALPTFSMKPKEKRKDGLSANYISPKRGLVCRVWAWGKENAVGIKRSGAIYHVVQRGGMCARELEVSSRKK